MVFHTLWVRFLVVLTEPKLNLFFANFRLVQPETRIFVNYCITTGIITM